MQVPLTSLLAQEKKSQRLNLNSSRGWWGKHVQNASITKCGALSMCTDCTCFSIRSHFSLHPGTFRPLHRQHVKNCKDNQTARAATRRQDVHEWSPRVLVARRNSVTVAVNAIFGLCRETWTLLSHQCSSTTAEDQKQTFFSHTSRHGSWQNLCKIRTSLSIVVKRARQDVWGQFSK